MKVLVLHMDSPGSIPGTTYDLLNTKFGNTELDSPWSRLGVAHPQIKK